MANWIVLPILIPFFTGVAALLLRRRLRAVRFISLLGALAGLAVALALLARVAGGGILTAQMDGWPAPYGITFVADLFSAIMLAAAALVGLAVLLYALGSVDPAREQAGFYPLYSFLLMGVCGSFLTGDLFNLYVFFEVMVVSSFGLLVLGGERGQLEGGIKYVVINMVSSVFLVCAVGIVYGTTGTLNMADLSLRLAAAPPGLTAVLASLFLIPLGLKAGVFPLFFWLPASYHTPPAVVSALFSGLLTKVGVYALVRVFTLIFVQEGAFTHGLLLVVAAATMVVGVLGAVAQYDLRRLLAFHIISQIGYMVMGLAFFSPLALAGTILHMVHNMIVKTNLFLVSGVIERRGGTAWLKDMGGLARRQPGLAALFLVSALALAGLPPLSGFFSKLVLVSAGLQDAHYLMVAVSLVVSMLTLFSMIKIWNEAFWKEAPAPLADAGGRTPLAALAPIILLAVLAVAMGLGGEWVYTWSLRAAAGLLDPAAYVQAVLGTAAPGP